MDTSWFEMKDYRRRLLKNAVWVPLRQSEIFEKRGDYGYPGYREEFMGAGSVALPLAHRSQASKLGWNDIGIIHSQRPWAAADYYKPVDVYQYTDRQDLGIELALEQQFAANEPREWHLNQDVVFALDLKREGDTWVRPAENYVEVARLRRNEGRPIALEIKNEFLRDYLAARGMFLRLSAYRSRSATVPFAAAENGTATDKDKSKNERFELRIWSTAKGGRMGSYAVFHVARTDVDQLEDVPIMGPETDENTRSQSWTGKHEGDEVTQVQGEVWREEEIEPAENSPRVRGDRVPTGITYAVDAGGRRMRSEELDSEDIGRWLWFKPDVVPAILKNRGAEFEWYTRDTAGVGFGRGSLIHIGLNASGLVNAYAYDIAKLPEWEQRIWVGFNVSPEAGVSSELLDSQMKAAPANTTAPEIMLPKIMEELDTAFGQRLGHPLFRPHGSTESLLEGVTRFKALEKGGLLALAKDLMRLIADRIDHVMLQKIVAPPSGEKWKSLKSLEKYLTTLAGTGEARALVGPLAGAYELRLADAHLPTTELEQAYSLARVDAGALPLEQGFQLISSVTEALLNILAALEGKAAQGE